MEAEQFINNAAAELEMVEAQLRENDARGAALRARADGLRFIVQYGQEAHAAPLPQSPVVAAALQAAAMTSTASAGGDIAQTEVVKEALGRIGRTAMTGEITDKVKAAGYDLSHEQVRSVLGYLMRKKPPQVERVRPGVWRLPKAAPSLAAFVPAPLTGASNGGRGES